MTEQGKIEFISNNIRLLEWLCQGESPLAWGLLNAACCTMSETRFVLCNTLTFLLTRFVTKETDKP